jgi:hypothetical protein
MISMLTRYDNKLHAFAGGGDPFVKLECKDTEFGAEWSTFEPITTCNFINATNSAGTAELHNIANVSTTNYLNN